MMSNVPINCPHVCAIAHDITDVQMNRFVAEGVATRFVKGDTIWTHGYELILLSKEMRAITENSRQVFSQITRSPLCAWSGFDVHMMYTMGCIRIACYYLLCLYQSRYFESSHIAHNL